MNKEEKEARYLINVLEDKKFTAQGEALRTYIEELNKKIDKLQEENEELENTLKQTQNSWFKDAERLDKLQKENEQKQETIDKIMKELEKFYMKYDVISKDKIRELKQKLLEEGYNLTEEQRQKETEFRQGKLKAYEELLGDE